MTKYPVITISRQYGSGGRFVGEQLAKKLDIPFYDNEIINLAAKKSGYSKEYFEKAEQKPTASLIYSLSVFSNVSASYQMPLNDRIFVAQSEVIKEVAAQGPCVIVGRCADYILRNHPNSMHVFIHSDIEHRINRVIKYYEVKPENASETILKADKRRATYYSYYTDKKWGVTDNYHLCINSDSIGIENSVEVIATFAKAFNKIK